MANKLAGTSKIGVPLKIHDKNGNELHTGDSIIWNGEECIILWNDYFEEYWAFLCYSKWYGDNIYDRNSYGKGYTLPMDDGARMCIELIKQDW